MKTILIFLTFISLSTIAIGADCSKAALELAQINLDQKAQSIGLSSGYINASSLNKISEDQQLDSILFSAVGVVHKANYTININLDGLCGIKSINIEE